MSDSKFDNRFPPENNEVPESRLSENPFYQEQHKHVQWVANQVLNRIEENGSRYLSEAFTFNNQVPTPYFLELLEQAANLSKLVFIDGDVAMNRLNKLDNSEGETSVELAIAKYLDQPIVGIKICLVPVPGRPEGNMQITPGLVTMPLIDFHADPKKSSTTFTGELIPDPITNTMPNIMDDSLALELAKEYLKATGLNPDWLTKKDGQKVQKNLTTLGKIIAGHAANAVYSIAKLEFANLYTSDPKVKPVLNQLVISPTNTQSLISKLTDEEKGLYGYADDTELITQRAIELAELKGLRQNTIVTINAKAFNWAEKPFVERFANKAQIKAQLSVAGTEYGLRNNVTIRSRALNTFKAIRDALGSFFQ